MCCLSKHDHSLLTGFSALVIISTETNTQKKKKCKSDYVTSNHTLIRQRLPCCTTCPCLPLRSHFLPLCPGPLALVRFICVLEQQNLFCPRAFSPATLFSWSSSHLGLQLSCTWLFPILQISAQI